MKKALGFLTLLFVGITSALAQGPVVLKPPKGAQLSIAVFEDLQCPKCRQTAPLLVQASKAYKIPLVRYDFPLPAHNWSFNAAVIARYFDTKSQQLGDDFRDYIFQHQLEIYPGVLRSFAEKFAQAHKVDLPFVVDPKGELAAKVVADRNLGQKVGIEHTPTVYILNGKPKARPYVEVEDNDKLFQTIDAMKRE